MEDKWVELVGVAPGRAAAHMAGELRRGRRARPGREEEHAKGRGRHPRDCHWASDFLSQDSVTFHFYKFYHQTDTDLGSCLVPKFL